MKRTLLLAVFFFALAAILAAALIGRRLMAGPNGNQAPSPADDRVTGLVATLLGGELDAPGSDDSPVAFEVVSGESFAQVAERLQAAGLVKRAAALRVLARMRGLDRGVQAGAYTLNRAMPAEQVLLTLQKATDTDVVTVTIPEGWRAEQVAARLSSSAVVTATDFMDAVLSGKTDVALLAGRAPGRSLEGYLFPDTYQFRHGAPAASVVNQMVANFEARFTPDMRVLASASGKSLDELVTLASIVERETPLASERPQVARVYLNRLETAPFLLQADPTVQYGLGFQPDTGQWWKRPLWSEDLDSDSPYNTYRHPNLPPGPIASPGSASIEAVLAPATGPWQYFVANDAACDGSHVFAETYAEHLANVSRYQNDTCRSTGD